MRVPSVPVARNGCSFAAPLSAAFDGRASNAPRKLGGTITEQGPIPKSELIEKQEFTVTHAGAALGQLIPDELAKVRRIQGFDVTGLAAIFHRIPHFRGHTQEIVHMTRVLLSDKYQIQWQPLTLEQGATK